MRLLHTADWHVGATLYSTDRMPDVTAMLEQIVMLAAEQQPDLILHSGDVFDQQAPGEQTRLLVARTLRRLGQIAPTIVIAGNHDSAVCWETFATIAAEDPRLHFIPVARPPERGGIIDIETSSGQRARIAPVPFVHPNRFVDWFAEEGAHATYAEQMRRIGERMHAGLTDGYDPSRDVLIYMGHTHLAGARVSGSEREIHVTADWAADPSSLPAVSYVALGHIHKPQDVPGGCYAGSTLQLDFAEAGEQKRLVLADCEPGQPAQITSLPLTAGRDLMVLKGTLEEIREQSAHVTDHLVKVTVTCEEPHDDLGATLREMMPEATIVEMLEIAANRKLTAIHHLDDADEREPTITELFDEYLAEKGTRTASAETVRQIYSELSDTRGAEEEPRVAGLAALLDAGLPTPPDADAILAAADATSAVPPAEHPPTEGAETSPPAETVSPVHDGEHDQATVPTLLPFD